MDSPVSSARGSDWLWGARIAAVGTLCFIAGSVAINYLAFLLVDPNPYLLALANAVLLPLAIATPLFLYIAMQLRHTARIMRQLSDSAATDALTRCLNATAFEARMRIYRNRRKGALLVLDVDHLNAVNDLFGHSWGNEALRSVAQAVLSSVRSGDLVARLGGTEFGIFLPGASRENAEDVGERIRQAISEIAFEPGGAKYPLTATGGAVVFEDDEDFDNLFRTADQQLREAKAGGRNRVVYADMPRGPSSGAPLVH